MLPRGAKHSWLYKQNICLRLYWYKVKLDITAAQCGGKAFQAFQAFQTGAAYYCGASS